MPDFRPNRPVSNALPRAAAKLGAAKLGAAFGLGALAAAAQLLPAHAADLAPAPVVQAPPAPSWAGFYAGTAVGYGFGSFRSSQAASRSASHGNVTTGAFIGYQFESAPFVYGGEAEIGVDTVHVPNSGVAPGLVGHVVEPIDTVRLRARLGYDLGAFLPFIAGGVAMKDTDVYGSPTNAFGQKSLDTGFSVGAGLEWRVGLPVLGPVALRAEYIYDNMPSRNYALAGGPVRVSGSEQYFRLALISYPGESWKSSSDNGPVDWSGNYAGVIGGGAWASPRTSFAGASSKIPASGTVFGLLGGHNFMLGNVMLGVEGVTELDSVHGRGTQPGVGVLTYRDYLDADLRGRAGYAFGRWLPYVTAGGDWSRSQQTDPTTGSSRNHVPAESFTFGGGVEYMIADRWSARVEYLHDAAFKNVNTGVDGLPLIQKRNADKVRVGLAYYFH